MSKEKVAEALLGLDSREKVLKALLRLDIGSSGTSALPFDAAEKIQGLLGASLPSPEQARDAALFESLAETKVRSEIKRIANQPANNGLFGGLFGLGNQRAIQFEKLLLEFAVARKVPFHPSSSWRNRALECAASEHTALKVGKRGKGRPRKPQIFDGLLAPKPSPPIHFEQAKQLIVAIAELQAVAAKQGQRLSQKKAIKQWLIAEDSSPTKVGNANQLDANIKNWEKRIKAAKRYLEENKSV